MGRPGQPNDVAPAFLFLACEDSSYRWGLVLHPNGVIIVKGWSETRQLLTARGLPLI